MIKEQKLQILGLSETKSSEDIKDPEMGLESFEIHRKYRDVNGREAYARRQEGQLSLCPLLWGAGGAKVALHTELFPSLLSCEQAFPALWIVLFRKLFLGASSHTPNF